MRRAGELLILVTLFHRICYLDTGEAGCYLEISFRVGVYLKKEYEWQKMSPCFDFEVLPYKSKNMK